MPELDGRGVGAQLRENESTRALPVVFMTAKNSPGEVATLHELNARGVIVKPFDPARLPGEFLAHLGAPEPADRAVEIPLDMHHAFLIAAGERLDAMERALDAMHRHPD